MINSLMPVIINTFRHKYFQISLQPSHKRILNLSFIQSPHSSQMLFPSNFIITKHLISRKKQNFRGLFFLPLFLILHMPL